MTVNSRLQPVESFRLGPHSDLGYALQCMRFTQDDYDVSAYEVSASRSGGHVTVNYFSDRAVESRPQHHRDEAECRTRPYRPPRRRQRPC